VLRMDKSAVEAALSSIASRSGMEMVLNYKTHILIGVRPGGRMEFLHQWPNVPTQVQEQIGRANLALQPTRFALGLR
jgi:hypothetical protein